MNEAVSMNNCLTMGVRGGRIVFPFIWQEFWKFICCVISALTYGKKLHKLWN